MKSALRKNAVTEIFRTKSRFLSIFCIVAIGIAFFAGVKVSSPDMKMTADSYYKETDLAHFRLVSTLGFSDKDVEALEGIEGITVYPAYFTDVLIASDETEETARIMSLKAYGESNEVNRLSLMEGRFPQNKSECVIDGTGFHASREVGEHITLLADGDEDLSQTLNTTEFDVTGVFISPMYIDKSTKGSTTVGNGSISAIIYIPEECFETEVYTELYITADELAAESAYSDGYDSVEEKLTDMLEEIGDEREVLRLEEIKQDAYEEVNDAQQELDDAKADADKELADAWQELEDGRIALEDGEKELADGKAELENSRVLLEDSRKELEDGRKQYDEGKAEFEQQIADAKAEIAEQEKLLADGEKQYEDGLAQYESGLAAYNDGKAQYDAALAEYEQGYAYYSLILQARGGDVTAVYALAQLAGAQLPPPNADGTLPVEAQMFVASLPSAEEVQAVLAQLAAAKVQLDETAQTLAASKAQLDSAKAQLDFSKQQLDEGKEQLAQGKELLESQEKEGRQQLEDSLAQLEDGERQYNEGLEKYQQGVKEIEEAEQTLSDSRKEYEDGVKEYEKAKADADKEIADAQQEIEDAKAEIEDLEPPSWYIFGRSGNPGYSEYGENAERINNIASVFPMFFILVAALVCLTTMTRMVEEQRSQIGTLKALGYTSGQVIFKYMFYALTATIAGALAGAAFGQKLFPFAIITAYGMLYTMPAMVIPMDWALTMVCLAVSAAAVALTVFACCKSELAECPAQLMRPKAPKAGKMIFLDKLPFWKKVSFNGKVTARNLFRYKRRMLMTVVGIAGCTALTLTGFALKDSISDIVEKQFSQLTFYDGLLAFESGEENEAEITDILTKNGGDGAVYFQKSVTVSCNGKNVTAYLIVPRDTEKFGKYYLFRDRNTHEEFSIERENILIDEKSSLLLGIRAGDEIQLYSDETDIHTVTVGECVENYPQHYVYMTEEMYKELFGEAPEYNMFAFSTGGQSEDELAGTLLESGKVLTVSYKDSLMTTMTKMMEALDSVILILIVSAGALAFVVLYNLTNINITERIREIATLKVMGFYDKEVDGYIFRENLILTLMGIAVGLFGGTFLAKFIIQTAEIDLVMFGRDISVLSYVISAAMTLLFSLIVTLYMHRRLKRIDMIEALKSVE